MRAEKTYSSLERHGDHPVDTILEKLSLPGVAKAPCPRFKEWTSDGKGLEFTLATMMPPVPSNIAFGPFNFEREPVQMVRCITADLLCDKYGIHVDPGEVYSPALVVAGHCSTSGGNSGTIAPAVLLGRSEDPHYRGLDTLLPHHRLVSWQGEIRVVVGADHHLFPQLSWHQIAGRVDSYFRDSASSESRFEHPRHMG